MNKTFLFTLSICLALISSNAVAQQQSWNWYFGNNAAVTFSSGSPVAVAGSMLTTNEGSCSISDAAGVLQFYSDGIRVWDRNDAQMPNGFGLLGNGSSTQSGVIVLKPGSTSLYYLFTADQGGYLGANRGIKYSTVDMTLNSTFGDVVLKNIMVDSPSVEKITAVRHCNGQDVWIVIHGVDDDAYKAYLLTSTGLSATPVITHIGIVHPSTFSYNETIGYLKASPDGRRLSSVRYNYMANDTAQVFDFDNSTGILSNCITIPFSESGIYGTAFSPNNQVLYIGSWGGNFIYQYDLSSNVEATINASRYVVETGTSVGAFQVGPDGKMYVTPNGSATLSVINNPDVLGIGCNYATGACSVSGTCSGGLPNFVDAFYSPPPATSENVNVVSCDSVLTLSPTGPGNSYLWSNGSTTQSITVHAPNNGTYWVHVIGATACFQTVNIADTFNVTFAVAPIVNLGPYHSVCGNGPDSLRAGNNGSTYLWSTGATTQNIGINTTGSYWVAVNNGGCTNRDTVVVTFVTNPTVNLGPDTTICSNASITLDAGNTGFNFLWNTGATTQTINVNTAGTYSVYVSQSVCHGRDTVNISLANVPIVNIGPDSTICSNQSVTLNAGNTGSSFNWSTGATTQNITATTSGVYWVQVSNSGCSARDSANITVINMPIVNLGPDSTLCIGNSLTLDAGNAGYNFHWSTGETTETITVNAIGNYWVIVNQGLCVTKDTIHINTIAPPVVNLGHDTMVCSPNIVTLHAGNPGNNYLWSSGQQTQNITVNNPGVYWVIVDNGSCVRTDSVTISVVTPPVLSTQFIADTTNGCNPLTINLTNQSSGGISYLWRFGDGDTSIAPNPNHIYVDSGLFTVTLIITNDTSTICGTYIDSAVYTAYIAVADPVHVTGNFTVSPVHGCTPLLVDFNNTSTNGTQFYWNFGNNTISYDENPLQRIYLNAGIYNITLIAFNPNARCYNPPDTVSIQVIADSCNLEIPNVFSPNGDGKNEFFHLAAEGYPNYHLIIFNRWGLKVFESFDKHNLWSGMINNTGSEAPDGTYYYIFTATDPENQPFSDHGYLTLIR